MTTIAEALNAADTRQVTVDLGGITVDVQYRAALLTSPQSAHFQQILRNDGVDGLSAFLGEIIASWSLDDVCNQTTIDSLGTVLGGRIAAAIVADIPAYLREETERHALSAALANPPQGLNA